MSESGLIADIWTYVSNVFEFTIARTPLDQTVNEDLITSTLMKYDIPDSEAKKKFFNKNGDYIPCDISDCIPYVRKDGTMYILDPQMDEDIDYDKYHTQVVIKPVAYETLMRIANTRIHFFKWCDCDRVCRKCCTEYIFL